VIDLTAGSSTYETVVKTVKLGTGSTSVSVTADGGLLYVASRDGNVVFVYTIDQGGGSAAGTNGAGSAGELVTIALVDTTAVGQAPQGVRISPDGALAMVPNEGSGTVSLLGTGASEQALAARLVSRLDRHLPTANDPDHAAALIELPSPYGPADLPRASVRLMGLLPCDTLAAADVADHDGNGIADLQVRFERWRLASVLAEGDSVAVRVEGDADSTSGAPPRRFVAGVVARVHRATIIAPAAGETPMGGSTVAVRWTPVLASASSAALLRTLDGGRTWSLAADSLPNSGVAIWTAPGVQADSARLAVVQVEQRYPDGSLEGPLALSGWFGLAEPVAVGPLPLRLELAPVSPDPARGPVQVRFALPRRAQIRLTIYDVQGREVAELARGPLEPGWHVARWEGRPGARMSPGLYFVRLTADAESRQSRFVWLR
jgi:hypothetical protein